MSISNEIASVAASRASRYIPFLYCWIYLHKHAIYKITVASKDGDEQSRAALYHFIIFVATCGIYLFALGTSFLR